MAGRPTKLTKDTIVKAREYLTEYKDEDSEFFSVFPIVEGLALFLGVHKDTIYGWKDRKGTLAKEFSDVLSTLKMEQARLLINGGFAGKFPPVLTKMALSKHGYIEESKVTQDITGDVIFTNGVPRPTKNVDGS